MKAFNITSYEQNISPMVFIHMPIAQSTRPPKKEDQEQIKTNFFLLHAERKKTSHSLDIYLTDKGW